MSSVEDEGFVGGYVKYFFFKDFVFVLELGGFFFEVGVIFERGRGMILG